MTSGLKAEAHRLGFHRVGIAPAVEPPDFGHLSAWLERGDHGGMGYMQKQGEARRSPAALLDGVRSVVMASLLYGPDPARSGRPEKARVARYAQGPEYHDVLWRRLEVLLKWLQSQEPSLNGRVVSDTAPLLERDFARRAGLGWIGKNTMLIDPKIGSFTVLGAVLLDKELVYDAPFEAFHCGTCTRCLDACPTDAFRGPFRLDARKCISYWTIEHKGDFPDEAADALHGWAFGCDVCQDVCPWNRKVREPGAPEWADWEEPDLVEWLRRDAAEFNRSLKGSAMSRTKRRGLVRNALALLAGHKVKAALPEIERLLGDADPVVAAAAARAFRKLADD